MQRLRIKFAGRYDRQVLKIKSERIQFIAEEEVEMYFKSADVLILPYEVFPRVACRSSVTALACPSSQRMLAP